MTTTQVTAATATKGFTSLDRETHVDELPVRGALPLWLQGSLLRTGPAQWEAGERSMNHWFDGFAMLHRFSFAAGAVSYANRFLETRASSVLTGIAATSVEEVELDDLGETAGSVDAEPKPKRTVTRKQQPPAPFARHCASPARQASWPPRPTCAPDSPSRCAGVGGSSPPSGRPNRRCE